MSAPYALIPRSYGSCHPVFGVVTSWLFTSVTCTQPQNGGAEARLEKGRLWRGLARLAVWTLRRVRFVAWHANNLGLSEAHRMQPRRRQAKSGD